MRNPVGVHSQSFSTAHASAALINTNNPTEEKYHPLISFLPKHTTLMLYTLMKYSAFTMPDITAQQPGKYHHTTVII